MPRSPDLPCAGCGRLMWRGKGTLPEGEAKCRDCRRDAKNAIDGAKGTKAAAAKKKRTLRAVRDGEKPSPPTKTTSDDDSEAEDESDDDGGTSPEAQRKRLIAIRRRVSVVIDDPETPARELGTLIRRELELTEKIKALDLASGRKDSVIATTGNESWDQSAI